MEVTSGLTSSRYSEERVAQKLCQAYETPLVFFNSAAAVFVIFSFQTIVVFIRKNRINKNMSLLNFAAAGTAAAAVLFIIIATGTTGWLVVSISGMDTKISTGLFKTCSSGLASACNNNINSDVPSDTVICGDHTVGQLNGRLRAQQAFGVLAILVGGVGAAVAILKVIGKRLPVVAGIASCVVASFFSLLAFALFTSLHNGWMYCGTSTCDMFKSQFMGVDISCGYNYSLALAILAWLLFIASAALQFIANKKDGDAAAYTPM